MRPWVSEKSLENREPPWWKSIAPFTKGQQWRTASSKKLGSGVIAELLELPPDADLELDLAFNTGEAASHIVVDLMIWVTRSVASLPNFLFFHFFFHERFDPIPFGGSSVHFWTSWRDFELIHSFLNWFYVFGVHLRCTFSDYHPTNLLSVLVSWLKSS